MIHADVVILVESKEVGGALLGTAAADFFSSARVDAITSIMQSSIEAALIIPPHPA
jgi:hypothetical protein